MQWLRDKEDQKEWDIETSMLREQYIKRLKEIAYARPPDREDDELTKLVQKYGKDALDEYKLEMEEKTDEEKAEYIDDAYESGE